MDAKIISLMEKVQPAVQREMEKAGMDEESQKIAAEAMAYMGGVMENANRAVEAQANFFEKMGVVADKLTILLDMQIKEKAATVKPKRPTRVPKK